MTSASAIDPTIFIIINSTMKPTSIRSPKRGDLVVDEIKRWIGERRLAPGDKLPKEGELQSLFGVSKGTAREALKSLEVQGLVRVSTGPSGGATVGEVPLDRAFQLVQNYLFFRDVNVAQIYAVRRILEPELAAGAIPHLTESDFEALARSIDTCAPAPKDASHELKQRQEDLHFHDILAAANPNALLRFFCEVINQLLRHGVAMPGQATRPAYRRLGETNVAAHRRLLAAARRRDANKVRKLMTEHIDEAGRVVAELDAAVRQRFVTDSDMQARFTPRETTR
jgi:GntR family transcriptional regulator, transcriptional repressor for pyruvate dehydrogenase complex